MSAEYTEPVDAVIAQDAPELAERTRGIVTNSGRFVARGPVGDVPSLGDIAVSLSRLPRFAGHTRGFWSVLDHTLFVVELARSAASASPFNFPFIEPEQRRALMRLALFHDAHETITADIPSPFKTSDMKYEQHLLDVRLFDRYNVRTESTDLDLVPLIAKIDHVAMLAEARVVGGNAYNVDSMVRKHFGAWPDSSAVALLTRLINDEYLGTGPVLLDADAHSGYRAFINHFITLA